MLIIFLCKETYFQKNLLQDGGLSLVEHLESAKRSVIFELLSREKSIFGLLSQSAILRMQNLDEYFNRQVH